MQYEYNTENRERVCVEYRGFSQFNNMPLFCVYREVRLTPESPWTEVPGSRTDGFRNHVRNVINMTWDPVIRLAQEEMGMFDPLITEEGSE